jgi:tetratricopeptide (TPR) repeat protein
MTSELPERLALARLDAAAKEFSSAHRHLEALACLEKGLVLRKRIFGIRSEEVRAPPLSPLSPPLPPTLTHPLPSSRRLQLWGAAKAAGELCNLLALSFLQREDYSRVDDLLRRAEVLTERDPAGRAVTYNNWACYLRQLGKLHSAHAFLERALALEDALPAVRNPADTRINLCSVLSQLHRHGEALAHAKKGLDLIQAEVFGGRAAAVAAGPGGAMAAIALSSPARIAVLCIAYHNLGVEHEFNKEFSAALKCYTKGADISKAFLGEANGITAAVRASQVAAAKTIAEERDRRQREEEEKERALANAAMAKVAAAAKEADGAPAGRE